MKYDVNVAVRIFHPQIGYYILESFIFIFFYIASVDSDVATDLPMKNKF